MDVGLLIMDEDPATAVRIARSADEAAIHSIWTIDYYNRNSLVRAGAFAAATESVLVGTSVTPVFSQAAVPLAAGAVDVQRVSGGRFVLGLGSSTRRMNRDWYGGDIDPPAPRFIERVQLIRQLIRHPGGPFTYQGAFDQITMAHLDRETPLEFPLEIFTAGVGPAMTRAVGAVADGFVGHPLATASFLREVSRPAVASSAERNGRGDSPLRVASQVIAAVHPDPEQARRAAALQVAFYSTVKGYDPLFPDGEHSDARTAARAAFASGDLDTMTAAGLEMVDDRAVFGTHSDVVEQLARYEGAVDWALLYPPHFGVDSTDLERNERSLIEVAAILRTAVSDLPPTRVAR